MSVKPVDRNGASADLEQDPNNVRGVQPRSNTERCNAVHGVFGCVQRVQRYVGVLDEYSNCVQSALRHERRVRRVRCSTTLVENPRYELHCSDVNEEEKNKTHFSPAIASETAHRPASSVALTSAPSIRALCTPSASPRTAASSK